MNHIIRFSRFNKKKKNPLRCESNFTVLNSPQFSYSTLHKIVIIIIHITIKTIWPIFKKLTQCIETNLVWHRRRDDWILGVKSRRSQGAVYREDIHSIFFFFFNCYDWWKWFPSPMGHTTRPIILNKSFKKNNLMHHHSGFYFFCSQITHAEVIILTNY